MNCELDDEDIDTIVKEVMNKILSENKTIYNEIVQFLNDEARTKCRGWLASFFQSDEVNERIDGILRVKCGSHLDEIRRELRNEIKDIKNTFVYTQMESTKQEIRNLKDEIFHIRKELLEIQEKK